MTVFLSDEQQMIRDMVREFAAAEIAPLASQLDAESRFPRELLPKLAALNLLGLSVPLEQGGAGVDAVCYAVALEEIARACTSTALVLLAHNSLACGTLLKHGSGEQQRLWLQPLARGELLGAFALSEPEAGSDVAALRTTAVPVDGGWKLRGTKSFVVNAAAADVFLVAAQTDRQATPEHGISVFLVERGAAGVETLLSEEMLGMRGAGIGQLVLDEVEVPAHQIVGAPGTGLGVALAALDRARLGIAAIAVGLAAGAGQRALDYARERPQFGHPIAWHQSVQERLAAMAIETSAARALVHETARAIESGSSPTRLSSAAKVFAAEVAGRATDHALQVHGGYGYIAEYHVERLYRDAKVCEIAYGSTDVLRLLVAQELVREAGET